MPHRGQQQQPMGAVHSHGVDPKQLQGPLQPLLGLGQLTLPEQRPTQGQVHDP